ncbi:MAG: hypothetical protein GC151_13870 [Betaproteobacteria bacterium]|nr:hypothetical protein [Betaproteobacteria bacterium]
MAEPKARIRTSDDAPPPVLLGYQQEWVDDQDDVAVWSKSRRIGASWCEAAACVLEASSASGQDALYIGYSKDMTQEFIEDCATWAKAFHLAAAEVGEDVFIDADDEGNTREIQAFKIVFASGRKVLALSSRPRSIRGKQGRVVIDEAAFHDDLEGLLKAALAMLIWGGKVRLLSSHNGEDNPFSLLCRDIREGRKPYSLHETTFRQAVDDGLYDRVMFMQSAIAKKRGRPIALPTREEWVARIYAQYGEHAAEELDCIPSQGTGVYLPRSIVERAMTRDIPVIRWSKPAEFVLQRDRMITTDEWVGDVLGPVIDRIPAGVRTALGQDFGRTGNLSVISILFDEGAGRWREACLVELRNIPHDSQARIRDYLLDRLPLLHHAMFDGRGNGEAHAEGAVQRLGPQRVTSVKATPSWYGTAWPKYKAALEELSIALAFSEAGIADHRRIVMRNGYPTVDDGEDTEKDGKRHGDSAIARLLAWMATLEGGQPPAMGNDVDNDPEAYRPEHARGRVSLAMHRRAA